MRHIIQHGLYELDLFNALSFAEFRVTLDLEMEKVQSLGIGTKKKQRSPLLLRMRRYYGRQDSLETILLKL